MFYCDRLSHSKFDLSLSEPVIPPVVSYFQLFPGADTEECPDAALYY